MRVSGYWLNDEGKRVDKDGNVLDENGNYIPTVEYITDDGDEISTEKTTKRKKSAATDS